MVDRQLALLQESQTAIKRLGVEKLPASLSGEIRENLRAAKLQVAVDDSLDVSAADDYLMSAKNSLEEVSNGDAPFSFLAAQRVFGFYLIQQMTRHRNYARQYAENGYRDPPTEPEFSARWGNYIHAAESAGGQLLVDGEYAPDIRKIAVEPALEVSALLLIAHHVLFHKTINIDHPREGFTREFESTAEDAGIDISSYEKALPFIAGNVPHAFGWIRDKVLPILAAEIKMRPETPETKAESKLIASFAAMLGHMAEAYRGMASSLERGR